MYDYNIPLFSGNRLLILLLTGLSLFLCTGVNAQTVTPASGGSNISADDFATGTWTTLTGPEIQETAPGQLSTGSIRLQAPDGFIWDTGGSAPVLTISAPKTQRITLDSQSRTDKELVFNISGNSGGSPPNNPHTLTFSNIRVRPSAGSPLKSGDIRNVGSAAPGGTINYGTLSMVAGADDRIQVENAPDASGSVVNAQDVEAGSSITVYANVVDQFGNFKRNESASWSLQNVTGGVSSGDLSASGSSATFTGELVGSADIRASSGGLTPVTSGTITVVHSTASTLAIATQPPSTATAGSPFSPAPVIEIRDDFTNIVTSDNFTEITATRNAGSGILQGTTTVTASNGTVSFNNLFHTVANDITIDFDASGFAGVTSNTVTVDHAAADSLTFIVQPPNGTTSQTLTPAPEVQLIDQFGNAVDQSGTSVSLAIVSGSGNINGTNPASTDADGIAVFNDISIDQNDTYVIKATASGLKDSENSDSFTIADAGKLAGFHVEITGGGNIGPQTAGSPFDIRIEAVDGSGAVLDGSSGRDNFTGNADLTTTSTFSGTTTTTNIGPFVNGVYDPHQVELTLSGDSHTITATNSAGSEKGSSNSFLVNPAAPDTDSSLVSVDPDTLIADGSSTSIVTVQLRDRFGNNLNDDVTETISIFIESGTGTLTGTTTGQGDGTYTDTLTAPDDVGSAVLGASVDGTDITSGNPEVAYIFGELATFLVEAEGGGNIGTQTAGNGFNIRITALDAANNTVETFDGTGSTAEITSSGTLSAGGGTTATFTNGILTSHSITITSAGSTTITARRTAGSETGTSNSFTIEPAAADPTTSTITSARSFLQNDGADNTTITVQLKDQFGNNIIAGGESVTLSTTAGSLSGVTDNGDGTYTATLTAGTSTATATITGTMNGQSIDDNAEVAITAFNEWESSGGGNPSSRTAWNNAGNWTLGVPTTGQVVIVGSGFANYPVIRDTDPVVDFLVIEQNASVTLDGSSGTRTLTVNNEISGDGSFFGNEGIINLLGDVNLAHFISGSSEIHFSGGSLQTVQGDFTGEMIHIENNVTVERYFETFADLNITTDNTLTMDTGSQLVVFGDLNINGALVGNGSVFQLGGDINGSNISLTNTSVELNGSAEQTINGIENIKSFTLNNPAGARVANDLTVTDTLHLTQGLLTIESGYSFVSNIKTGNTDNLRMLREIAGNPGWRLIAPSIASTYEDFLDGTVTQGYSNSQLGITDANSDSLQPNVLYYDETNPGTDNQRWRAPADATDNLSAGRGLFVYFFGDIPEDNRYNDPLPDTLDIQGEEFDGDGTEFTFPVTYTADADTGWNMVGNPFAATIDWDDGNWTKTNMDNTLYVWDPASNDYLYWNGIAGSLADGRIKPFQGFWVKANGEGAPELKVEKSSKTTGGTFRGKAEKEPAAIEFLLEAGNQTKTTHITLTPEGKTGKDKWDAFRLLPFETDTYLEFFTAFDDGTQLAINNLARSFGKEIAIPLYVGGFQNGEPVGGEYTLSWPVFSDVPDAWTIILEDLETGQKIDLRTNNFYSFNRSADKQKSAAVNTMSNFRLVTGSNSKKKGSDDGPRFYIRIDPGADADGLPHEYRLNTNYPNPFNGSTRFRFETPLEGNVQLIIYDILGRKIQTLVDEDYQAGFHEFEWTPSRLASGVYICIMRAGGKQFSLKITYIK